MPSFDLHIDCDNDAFYENPLREISRLLRDVAHRLDDRPPSPQVTNSIQRLPVTWPATETLTLRDTNGNTVGTAKISAPPSTPPPARPTLPGPPLEDNNDYARWAHSQAVRPSHADVPTATTFGLLAIAEELHKIRKTMLALEGAEDTPEGDPT